jgi:hypothetical protein
MPAPKDPKTCTKGDLDARKGPLLYSRLVAALERLEGLSAGVRHIGDNRKKTPLKLNP